MSDRLKRPTYEDLIEGRVSSVSLINEPVTFEVDFTVPEESATARVMRRWFKRQYHE